jgi:hypothetical protein
MPISSVEVHQYVVRSSDVVPEQGAERVPEQGAEPVPEQGAEIS